MIVDIHDRNLIEELCVFFIDWAALFEIARVENNDNIEVVCSRGNGDIICIDFVVCWGKVNREILFMLFIAKLGDWCLVGINGTNEFSSIAQSVLDVFRAWEELKFLWEWGRYDKRWLLLEFFQNMKECKACTDTVGCCCLLCGDKNLLMFFQKFLELLLR